MYDSTVTLSAKGTIIKVDADFNDPLFKEGVNYAGKSFLALFASTNTELLNNFFTLIFSSGKLQSVDFFFGSSFYQLKGVLCDEHEAICIITNNTRQRRMLLELEHNNLNTIVDAYQDSVWSFDKDFNLVTANKTFLESRSKAVSTNERLHIGENIFKYAPEASYKKWVPIYERALAGEIICFEENRRTAQGEEYDVEIYLTPVYNNASEIIGCLGVTRDITERKASQQVIEDYTAKLEEFAFTTSHHLRRPIANIMGMSTMLSDEMLDADEKTKAVQYITQSVNELDSIVVSMIQMIQQYKK